MNRVTFSLPGQTARELADGIAALMDDIAAGAPRIAQVQAEAERWRASHRYSRLGDRLYNVMSALHAAQAWEQHARARPRFPSARR